MWEEEERGGREHQRGQCVIRATVRQLLMTFSRHTGLRKTRVSLSRLAGKPAPRM